MTTKIPDSLLVSGGSGGGGGTGSVATDSIFVTKGDIPVGTGASVAARLAIGSAGQVLTVDSATTVGMKWTTPTVYGNASGPASAVNNRVVFFDGTTGKLIKDSGLTLSGANTGDQTISDVTTTFTDVTTNNSSTLKHGYLPKLSGSSSQYLAGDGSWATPAGGGGGGDMYKADNLAGLVNTATARTNLGLGTLATQSGTFSGTSSGTNTGDQDLSGLLTKANNLSGLASASTARANLGLGSITTRNITVSTSDPTGGADGDLWLKYTA